MPCRPEAVNAPENASPFTCKQCGDCCFGFGGTYVTEQDIQRIADYIDVDPQQFVARFCRRSGEKQILVQGDEGYCIFWKGNCTIHPVKPKMCREWPYIASLYIDFGNWSAMASMCPGMRKRATWDEVKVHMRHITSKSSA